MAVDRSWIEGVRTRNQRRLGLSGMSGLGATPQEIVSRFRATAPAPSSAAPAGVLSTSALVAPPRVVSAAAPSAGGWARWLLVGAGVITVGGIAYAVMRR